MSGLHLAPIFADKMGSKHPYETVTWVQRDVVQENWKTGETVFEQRGVEFPDFWSLNAVTIATTKYFRGALGTPERESSLKQLISRVVDTYTAAGIEHGYFDAEGAKTFNADLTYALLHQYFAFNSPVWFNVGTSSPQQVSACFLLGVEDTMESILNWYTEEGMIFKGGSGAGVNLSKIRSSKELLSSGGTASGPVSFMRGADASAGTIKSGGATRRAAKLVCLDVDHPDIEEFISVKVDEERKIRALRDAGFDMDLGGKDIVSVQYQNANNSVQVSDKFMRAVQDDGMFDLIARGDGSVMQTVRARDLFSKMAQAAWACADPGIQYSDTINDWHTIPNEGRISTSNPCFTGDTLVAVADGRNAVRIDQLAAEGKSVNVYTKDERGRTTIRPMKDIRLTRADTEILRVTFDDGTSVRCTPDHPFMLNDGTFLEASSLTSGMSLKRFDSEVVPYGSPSGTLRRRVSGARGWNWQHHKIAEHKFGPYRDGANGVHLNHIDNDALNDSPDNLELLTRDQHNEKSVAAHMMGLYNPVHRMTEEWRRSLSEATKGNKNGRYIDVDDETLFDVYCHAMDHQSTRTSHDWVKWNNYVRRNNLVGVVPLVRSAGGGNGRVRGMNWDDFVSSITKPVNHKVVSVEPCGRADVYDGEVEEFHNFAIITSVVGHDPRTASLSGVFVHNCGEYLSVDNSSCNLASLNLMKFREADGTFNVELFVKLTKLIITAMDISICFGAFPTQKITDNTRKYRQLGIGYANLGALLMSCGLPYDSPDGRAFAAAITSVMSAAAHDQSAAIAAHLDAYEGWDRNREAHLRVVGKHVEAAKHAANSDGPSNTDKLHAAAQKLWSSAERQAGQGGLRNSQLSLLAPTGTIGFMMDCDTTGIEPDFALVKFKKLVGGSSMQIVNQTVLMALGHLGYTPEQAGQIVDHITSHGHVVGAPGLNETHYAVFDCAVGQRSIEPMGHVRMMAAVQPFLSGSISKTINLPETATVADIERVYLDGWVLGLKSLAVYRDNCKVGQPLSDANSSKPSEPHVKPDPEVVEVRVPTRVKLPRSRTGRTTRFTVGGAEGYMTTGEYGDGRIGELFLKLGKQGSTLAGVMDGFAVAISIALQYGVPLDTFVEKFTNSRFEPAGMTDDAELRMAQSLLDYVFRRLAVDYLNFDDRSDLGVLTSSERARYAETGAYQSDEVADSVAAAAVSVELEPSRKHEGRICRSCGSGDMVRTGACHACRQCGTSDGCS